MRKLALLLCLLPMTGYAVPLSWTNATFNECEDPCTVPTPIPATGDGALDTTSLTYSLCDITDQLVLPGTVFTVSSALLTTDIDPPTEGRWCFGAKHTNVGGMTSSSFSNIVVAVLVLAPTSPENLAVSDTMVYSIIKQVNGILLLPVGTIPLGTPCDPTQSANGFYVVDVNLATFTNPAQDPPVVVAACEGDITISGQTG